MTKDASLFRGDTMPARILGIGGSPRKNGNSDILLERLLAGARSGGAATDVVQLRDSDFAPCIGCERCRQDRRCTGLDDDMRHVHEKLVAARGLVLVSPVHSYTVTAPVKAFLDRLYCFYDFGPERPGPVSSRLAGQGRKAIIAAVGEQSTVEEGGMDTTISILRRNIEILGYDIVGELAVLGAFERGAVREQPRALDAAEDLGRRLASELSSY
jgi:multimeric flavodoxin WrbA